VYQKTINIYAETLRKNGRTASLDKQNKEISLKQPIIFILRIIAQILYI